MMRLSNSVAAAIGATLLMAGATAASVNAQEHPVHDCKGELVKATGASTFLGMGRARRLAIDNWQREVRQRYGERYMDFTHARHANWECESASIGTFGQFNKRCTVLGHPCAPGAPIEQPTQPDGPLIGHRLICHAQQLLIRIRYLARDQLDCEFGPITRSAVIRFQLHNRLPPTGELNSVTMERLRRAAGDQVG